MNTNKISLCKKGPQKLILKGYKITLSGRFENTKNPMSKTYTTKNGFITLTSLNNNIDFISKNLYTKLGICNIKIWLFYKIN
uniref:Ribosomal protein S3 n=1 Tax=Dasya binghamiae TaxID=1896963 RepID=A0A1C8XRT3_9FLOR|nr:ribosomal protein S3 [Dasya binghamiae]AOH77202.1 ribosomal protein S3 [Dasya binghamiae]